MARAEPGPEAQETELPEDGDRHRSRAVAAFWAAGAGSRSRRKEPPGGRGARDRIPGRFRRTGPPLPAPPPLPEPETAPVIPAAPEPEIDAAPPEVRQEEAAPVLPEAEDLEETGEVSEAAVRRGCSAACGNG